MADIPQFKGAEARYREYLDTLSLTTLRVLGREHGVAHATSSKKGELIDAIVSVLTGKQQPAPRTKRGAPVKQSYLDPEVVRALQEIGRTYRYEAEGERAYAGVASPDLPDRPTYDEPVYSGILELMQGGYGFLRANNCQPSAGRKDVFLPAPVLHSLALREGDLVACTATPRQQNDAPAFDKLLSVNGLPAGRYERRPNFDALTACYPKERITLSREGSPLSLRAIDLFMPIGKGQRALIVAPPKAGKTTLLKEIAASIVTAHREVALIILLIDERPEEVTDFRTSVPDAEIVSSTFDEGAEHHVRAAKLTIERAKRLAEQGVDVVLLVDSLTKLTRAYNFLTESTGKTLTGGLDAGAFMEPKRFFGAARGTVEGGSITILATALVETGSRMDDIIYEEFKGTGNCDIFLSRELAQRRVFPALDVLRSGTRKEELLLTQEELSAVYKMRERGLTQNTAGLFEMMRRTKENGEFVARLTEWLRLYKNS